ncbi:MAG: glycoside hydrolase family 2 TIM barrel-domain containing protein [Phycisphaerae bacterium]
MLKVDGQPYTVRGAGGYERLAELRAAGANSLRLWHSEDHDWVDIGKLLDQAHELGMTVMLGLEVKTARAFRYGDIVAKTEQLERLRKVVRRWQNHPALLCWGVGNELEWDQNRDAPPALWQAVNQIAQMVKAEDPHHPTVVVLAGQDVWKIRAVMQHCPAIDILGINSYGPLPQLPGRLAEVGWKKPYLVTEYGPIGWWESPKTAWNARIEGSSSTKAQNYWDGYRKGVGGQPNCLGSYAFIWGRKEEGSFTWFGTFTDQGDTLANVDVLSELWTGQAPRQRAPTLDSVQLDQPADAVASSITVWATLQGATPGCTVEWILATDRSMYTFSGELHENRPAEILRRWTTTELQTTFTAPQQPDTYRLYALIRDGHGKAATANIPFRVLSPATTSAK